MFSFMSISKSPSLDDIGSIDPISEQFSLIIFNVLWHGKASILTVSTSSTQSSLGCIDQGLPFSFLRPARRGDSL